MRRCLVLRASGEATPKAARAPGRRPSAAAKSAGVAAERKGQLRRQQAAEVQQQQPLDAPAAQPSTSTSSVQSTSRVGSRGPGGRRAGSSSSSSSGGPGRQAGSLAAQAARGAIDNEEEEEEEEEEHEGEGWGGEDDDDAGLMALRQAGLDAFQELDNPAPPPTDLLPPTTRTSLEQALAATPLSPTLHAPTLTAVERGRLPRDPAALSRLAQQLPGFLAAAQQLPDRLSQVAAALGVDAADSLALTLAAPHLLLPSPAELAARLEALGGALELGEGEAAVEWALQNPVLLAVPSATLEAKLVNMKEATGLSRKQSARLLTRWMFPELR